MNIKSWPQKHLEQQSTPSLNNSSTPKCRHTCRNQKFRPLRRTACLNRLSKHLEEEIQLKGLEAPEELQINTDSQRKARTNAEEPNTTFHCCKKPEHYGYQGKKRYVLKRQKEQVEGTQVNPGNRNSGADKTTITSRQQQQQNTSRAGRKLKTVYPPCETSRKTNNSTGKCNYGANAAKRLPPRHRRPGGQNQVQQRDNQNSPKDSAQAAAQNIN